MVYKGFANHPLIVRQTSNKHCLFAYAPTKKLILTSLQVCFSERILSIKKECKRSHHFNELTNEDINYDFQNLNFLLVNGERSPKDAGCFLTDHQACSRRLPII